MNDSKIKTTSRRLCPSADGKKRNPKSSPRDIRRSDIKIKATLPIGSEKLKGQSLLPDTPLPDGQENKTTFCSSSKNPLSNPPPPNGPLGIVLENKYRLQEEIGRGAMGTVFAANDMILKRKVAVKFLLPELAKSSKCSSRFHQEAVGMASVRDNNVAQIYAFGEYGNSPYFVMEFLDGQTAEELINAYNKRGFFIPLLDVLDILIQCCAGVEAIHKTGAVHRDIKPSNIMLSDDPLRAVIMDFGLVRNVKMDDDLKALAGTPAYIAPELVEGIPGSDNSPIADVYSMGITAYELLTGSLPFSGDDWVEILRRHISQIPDPPSLKRAGLSEHIDTIIMTALLKDPKQRYQNCTELLDDLLEIREIAAEEEQRPSQAPSRRYPTNPRLTKAGRSTPGRIFRSTPAGNRGRLLIADSDPQFRNMVHETAKAVVPGCRIKSVTDGETALSEIESFNPHVLIIDLSSGEINGLEVAATLNADEKTRNIDIVVVSDHGGGEEIKLLKSLGVKEFITKPVEPQTLAEIIRPLLEKTINQVE